MAFTEPWPAPMRLDLSSPLPEEGVRVRLRISFSTWRVWPLALFTNSLNPLLRLYDDRIETRVMWKVRHRYAEISLVETFAHDRSEGPSMLEVTWAGRRFQFLGRPMRAENVGLVLQFLAGRDVPLGPKAMAFLDRASGDGA